MAPPPPSSHINKALVGSQRIKTKKNKPQILFKQSLGKPKDNRENKNEDI